MKRRFVFPLLLSASALVACSSHPKSFQDNGHILWSNGVEEKVHVTPSNEHFLFMNNSGVSAQVVVYSRINGAGTPRCEYYVNEPKPRVRLTVCGNGEVELLENGIVKNVGQISVFIK
ncbi:hypothetical protein L4D06_01150 [Enterovibrio makurazakiensis]|uniref:hypothetical protein n=1 Tax=Enterovibrio makurazakiensis TaxID=2910232 RepID=UPI003D2014D3